MDKVTIEYNQALSNHGNTNKVKKKIDRKKKGRKKEEGKMKTGKVAGIVTHRST
jgi:hypothetical protein